MSKASALAAAIFERLSAISTANGYETNVGSRGFRGRRKLEEEHMPCFVLHEGEDTPQDDARKAVSLRQQYIVEGHMQCDPNHPNDAAHKMIADFMKALWSAPFQGTQQIFYKGRAIAAREDGANSVSCFIRFDVSYPVTLDNP
jgi:hypothetical protein